MACCARVHVRVRVSARVPERVCAKPGRRGCPWGGDRPLGGKARSEGTAIRKQLEALIGRYITSSLGDIDVCLRLELTPPPHHIPLRLLSG